MGADTARPVWQVLPDHTLGCRSASSCWEKYPRLGVCSLPARCAMGWHRRPAGPQSWHASGTGLGRGSECASLSPCLLLTADAHPTVLPHRRGLIMGIWNSHTSVGNILGSLIAGVWVSSDWGLSFIVPGIIIAVIGIICFFFLVEREW